MNVSFHHVIEGPPEYDQCDMFLCPYVAIVIGSPLLISESASQLGTSSLSLLHLYFSSLPPVLLFSILKSMVNDVFK